MGLTRHQWVLVHQVHPAKLAVDLGTSIVSDVLPWRHHLVTGLAVRYLSPAVGSTLVSRFADVERLSASRAGQYILTPKRFKLESERGEALTLEETVADAIATPA